MQFYINKIHNIFPGRIQYISHVRSCNLVVFFFFLRWVLYEKPNFKGEKIAVDEGDIEITCPFNLPAEQLQNGHEDGKEQNGEKSNVQTESEPARKSIIGSIRRAVRVRKDQFSFLCYWMKMTCTSLQQSFCYAGKVNSYRKHFCTGVFNSLL